MSHQQFKDSDFKVSSVCDPSSQTGCVAVAICEGMVALRDTKDRNQNDLHFTSEEWKAFIAGVKKGDFDL